MTANIVLVLVFDIRRSTGTGFFQSVHGFGESLKGKPHGAKAPWDQSPLGAAAAMLMAAGTWRVKKSGVNRR
jgi:hypothetical protein